MLTPVPTPTDKKYVVFRSRKFGHMFFSLSGGDYDPAVYVVVGADKAALLAAATPNRNVMVISPKVLLDELEPASPAVIEAALTIVDQIKSAASVKLSKMRKGDLSGLHTAPAEKDAVIREDLTAKMEAAELRSTEARDRVRLLETQLSAAMQEAGEAAQALEFLDDIASAPVSVIRAILG